MTKICQACETRQILFTGVMPIFHLLRLGLATGIFHFRRGVSGFAHVGQR